LKNDTLAVTKCFLGDVAADKLKNKLAHSCGSQPIMQVVEDDLHSKVREGLGDSLDITTLPRKVIHYVETRVGKHTTRLDYALCCQSKRARGLEATVDVKSTGIKAGDDVSAEVFIESFVKDATPDPNITGVVVEEVEDGMVTLKMKIGKKAVDGRRTVQVYQGGQANWWQKFLWKEHIGVTDLRVMIIAVDGLRHDAFKAGIDKLSSGVKLQEKGVWIKNNLTAETESWNWVNGLSGTQDLKDLLDKITDEVELPTAFDEIVGTGYKNCLSLGRPNKTEARNFLPTVTWCNWASVFTGTPPKDHGVTGLPFFPRDMIGQRPILSAGGAINCKNNAELDYSLGAAWENGTGDWRSLTDMIDTFAFGAFGFLDDGFYQTTPTLYEQANGLGLESLVAINMVQRGAKKAKGGFPALLLAGNQALSFTSPSPVHTVLKDVGLGKLVSTHNSVDAAVRDLTAVNGVMSGVLAHEKMMPDIMTCYLPGVDTTTHGEGVQVGKEYFWAMVDTLFWPVYKTMKLRGYDTSTLFVFVSDHGMSDVAQAADGTRASYDQQVVALQDADGIDDDIGPVLKETLGYDTWGYGSDGEEEVNKIWQAKAVYSPNGGMAHIYLRPDMNLPWDSPTSLNCNSNFVVASHFAVVNRIVQNPFYERFAAVIYRDVNNWNAGYRCITINHQNMPESDVLSSLPSEWSIQNRIAELSSSRSGDVILIFGKSSGGSRYIGWNWEKEVYKAWHGEPDIESSKVPLVFAFAGGDVEQLDAMVSPHGDVTNADLTDYTIQILQSLRGK
ncbi:MAG: alkaline phosphatase family protein, partial [Candidatus Cloacimonetes bacterium]|nr:alkaline phosphatase family protein [Candidatus Cloacimonadota bacterium]